MNKGQFILNRGQPLDNYTVRFPVKKGSYAETYRVQNQNKETLFLKLFDLAKLHRTQFTDSGDVLEIEVLKSLKHPNLVKYHDSGNTIINNQKFAYVVLGFVSGETLAEKMERETRLNPYQTKAIIQGVLNGVNYLHKNQIIHNDLTNQNIMLDLSGNIEISKITDFGHARFLEQTNKDFLKSGLNMFYTANEAFNGVFSFQSDVYSVGALYYHLLVGLPPYFIDISKYKSDVELLEEVVLSERKKVLKLPNYIDKQTQNIIRKALQPEAENRFKTAKEFLQAVNGDFDVELSVLSQEKRIEKPLKEKKKGKGFSAIAGMQELKDTIKLDVIDALNDKERYAEYGLTIPNGMLLYGPPGCGKTFFAEKMAEEIGFNFYQIKPSDIQSKWVNATQENIKELFDEARENAPSIIFIDELDAVVPSRDTANISHMNTSAVNEFLAQMNNCSENGIFVIGATNRPDAIDLAVLRSGRLDKHFYLPPPDFEARKMMFEMYLKKRPIELGLKYEKFAEATENYVSSDIRFLCDEAARIALKNNQRISEEIVLKAIKSKKPSITSDQLKAYTNLIDKFEGKRKVDDRPRVGFT